MPFAAINAERVSDRWWVVALESRQPVFGRSRGMEIDRNVKFLGLCKQGPVGFVVIAAPFVVIVDETDRDFVQSVVVW